MLNLIWQWRWAGIPAKSSDIFAATHTYSRRHKMGRYAGSDPRDHGQVGERALCGLYRACLAKEKEKCQQFFPRKKVI